MVIRYEIDRINSLPFKFVFLGQKDDLSWQEVNRIIKLKA